MQIDRDAPHRIRLLQAMTGAVVEKGYAAVTIADVVAAAGVSKRTFYEHFTGKEDCFFSCYAEASNLLAAVVREAAEGAGSAPGRVVATVHAYVGALDEAGPVVAAVLSEIQATSGGRELRRQKMHDFAALIRDLLEEDIRRGLCAPLDEPLSLAMVGGIYELVESHAETSPDVPFRAIAPSVERFIRSLLRPEPASGGSAGCSLGGSVEP